MVQFSNFFRMLSVQFLIYIGLHPYFDICPPRNDCGYYCGYRRQHFKNYIHKPNFSSTFRLNDRITPGSPGKFLMAAFVRPYAQKMTAEIYPVQPIVICAYSKVTLTLFHGHPQDASAL
jgi:hypothetical protein